MDESQPPQLLPNISSNSNYPFNEDVTGAFSLAVNDCLNFHWKFLEFQNQLLDVQGVIIVGWYIGVDEHRFDIGEQVLISELNHSSHFHVKTTLSLFYKLFINQERRLDNLILLTLNYTILRLVNLVIIYYCLDDAWQFLDLRDQLTWDQRAVEVRRMGSKSIDGIMPNDNFLNFLL